MKSLMFVVLVLSALFLTSPLPAEQTSAGAFSLSLWPEIAFPSPLDANAARFSFVAGAKLSGEYILPFFPSLFANASIGYGYNSLSTGGTIYSGSNVSISLLSASAGIGYRIPIVDWLTFRLLASAGYYYGIASISGVSGGSAFVEGGPGVSFALGPSLGLGVGASYRLYGNLFQAINAAIGLSYTFGATAAPTAAAPKVKAPESTPRPQPLNNLPGKGLAIQDLAFSNIFPILHAFYDDHPIGKLTIKNTEGSSLTGVSVKLFIPQYMDAAKECPTAEELKPGEEREVDLLALFKNSILDVTEGTKVAAEVTVAYTLNGSPMTLTKSETVRIYNRNALTWDDNRKAAAFVTAKDPSVLLFSNNINVAVNDKMNRAVDKNLQTAMALHDALRLYGMSYVSNPLTPYSVVSKDKLAVDTLKFPRQTFEYHSGDCSDLSLLYCALLESVQVETAFITIPGHIFMAFALKASPDEARASFSHTDELIFRNGKAWVPVEVTERQGTFLTAWREGAGEWRENLSKNLADFYPVHDAWKIYEPVGLPGSGTPPTIPDGGKVAKDFQNDVSAFIELQIYENIAELQAAVTKSKHSPKTVNSLGVLYARYGLEDKAEAEFREAVEKDEYVPALVNLGNLYYLKPDMKKALSFYERAQKKAPDDPTTLLGLARVNQELENFGVVKEVYTELKKVSPRLAGQFAYLELKGEESTRAAEISGTKEMVVWDEE